MGACSIWKGAGFRVARCFRLHNTPIPFHKFGWRKHKTRGSLGANPKLPRWCYDILRQVFHL